MLLELTVNYSVAVIIGFGAAFALTGLIFRRGPGGKQDRDNLVYADGFQGATIATLIVVAVAVYYIDDKRSGPLLKEQTSLVSLYAILGVMQQLDRFRRSLTQ